MPVRNPVQDVLATIAVLEKAKAACAHLTPPGAMRRHEDLYTRARLIHAVLRTRQQLQGLHDRSLQLVSALERFRARSAAMRT